MGSIMQNAAMNTLMGMGTVFFVLVLISIIIYGFSFIGKMQNKVPAKKKKEKVKKYDNVVIPETIESPEEEKIEEEQPVEEAVETPVEEVPAEEEEELCDDLELVAVIAAAIAAYEDVPADSFVVRSIRRKKTADRWKNA